MEEIVRAFNWVIEKGWVRSIHSEHAFLALTFPAGLLLGHLGVVSCPDRGSVPYVYSLDASRTYVLTGPHNRRRHAAEPDPAHCGAVPAPVRVCVSQPRCG